jgi:hypothetical protein
MKSDHIDRRRGSEEARRRRAGPARQIHGQAFSDQARDRYDSLSRDRDRQTVKDAQDFGAAELY